MYGKNPQAKVKVERCFKTIKEGWMYAKDWNKFKTIEEMFMYEESSKISSDKTTSFFQYFIFISIFS